MASRRADPNMGPTKDRPAPRKAFRKLVDQTTNQLTHMANLMEHETAVHRRYAGGYGSRKDGNRVDQTILEHVRESPNYADSSQMTSGQKDLAAATLYDENVKFPEIARRLDFLSPDHAKRAVMRGQAAIKGVLTDDKEALVKDFLLAKQDRLKKLEAIQSGWDPIRMPANADEARGPSQVEMKDRLTAFRLAEMVEENAISLLGAREPSEVRHTIVSGMAEEEISSNLNALIAGRTDIIDAEIVEDTDDPPATSSHGVADPITRQRLAEEAKRERREAAKRAALASIREA